MDVPCFPERRLVRHRQLNLSLRDYRLALLRHGILAFPKKKDQNDTKLFLKLIKWLHASTVFQKKNQQASIPTLTKSPGGPMVPASPSSPPDPCRGNRALYQKKTVLVQVKWKMCLFRPKL